MYGNIARSSHVLQAVRVCVGSLHVNSATDWKHAQASCRKSVKSRRLIFHQWSPTLMHLSTCTADAIAAKSVIMNTSCGCLPMVLALLLISFCHGACTATSSMCGKEGNDINAHMRMRMRMRMNDVSAPRFWSHFLPSLLSLTCTNAWDWRQQ